MLKASFMVVWKLITLGERLDGGHVEKDKKVGRNKYYGCRKESWVAHPGAEKKKAKLWHPLHPLLKLSFMCDPSVCAKSLLC